MNESQVIKSILEYLAAKKIMAWRSNNGGVYDPTKGVFRIFRGLKGVSDILGCLRPSGRLLAIECKTDVGVIRPDQEEFLDTINMLGGLGFVARSIGDVEKYGL